MTRKGTTHGPKQYYQVVPFWAKPSGQLKAPRKRPVRVLPWPGRVLPSSTLPGHFCAQAPAGSNHFSLVRPKIIIYWIVCIVNSKKISNKNNLIRLSKLEYIWDHPYLLKRVKVRAPKLERRKGWMLKGPGLNLLVLPISVCKYKPDRRWEICYNPNLP